MEGVLTDDFEIRCTLDLKKKQKSCICSCEVGVSAMKVQCLVYIYNLSDRCQKKDVKQRGIDADTSVKRCLGVGAAEEQHEREEEIKKENELQKKVRKEEQI